VTADVIRGVELTEKQRRYKFGDIILRERKGRYYVYMLEGANGDVRETYVGPLTDVVETYLKLKLEAGVLGGVPLTGPGGFEPPTTGSGGGNEGVDRRKIALVANLRQYATEGNVKAFFDYLVNERKISERTAKQYVSAIFKPFRETRNSQKAYRLFARFLASRGVISDEFAEKVLKAVKVKRTNADVYIPTLEEVVKTLELAKEYSEDVYFVYRLALESGSRLSEDTARPEGTGEGRVRRVGLLLPPSLATRLQGRLLRLPRDAPAGGRHNEVRRCGLREAP